MQLNKKNKLLNQLYISKILGYKYHNDIDISSQNITFRLPNNIKEIDSIINNCSLCTFSNKSNNKLTNLIKINKDILFISTFNLDTNDELFNAMLKNVLNLSIDDVNLLSIIKCDVETQINCEAEINICKDYVNKQIELLKPKLIIMLGDSYNYLLNNNVNVNNIRGSMLKYKDINLLVMYHPEILRRNPSLKKDTLLDLQKIKLIMETF